MDTICRFRNEYRFLSNFYPAPVSYEGALYPTAEHAYQAAKTVSLEEREAVAMAKSPGSAKRAGHHVAMRRDWEEVKVEVMTQIVRTKFKTHSDLAAQLVATGDAELVEGNNWGDTFWGMYQGKGQNILGKILMQVRAELQKPKEAD